MTILKFCQQSHLMQSALLLCVLRVPKPFYYYYYYFIIIAIKLGSSKRFSLSTCDVFIERLKTM